MSVSNRSSKFLHRASTGEDIADAALELSFDEIEEEFMNLELAQEAFQGTHSAPLVFST